MTKAAAATAALPTHASDADPGSAARLLYDDRREQQYRKPTMRGWQHLVWFIASVGVNGYVLGQVHGDLRLTGFAIYAATVSGLFGTSALYHRGDWSPRASAVLQRADHTMIFFLIAGSATPEFLFALPGATGKLAVAAVWTLTISLTVTHLCWMNAPERLVGGAFILLGWGAAAGLPAVWINFGVAPAVLIVAGGVLYTAGAICYHRRSPDPRPTVFGYHEVFHAFVCAAATCHYVAITIFLL
jgi:hemolysin III